MRKYYQMVQGDDGADLYIYGDIVSYPLYDSDVSEKSIIDEIEDVTGNSINVHISSYGGEVKTGLAIYNALKRKAKEIKVTTYCDGFACSIASVVFMAGTERKMSKASLLMIHNAWTSAEGNADELRKLAGDLDIITGASIEAYKEVANIGEEKIRELMNNESWISPKDALKYGFCTEIVDEKAENPSQSVKQALLSIIMAANKAAKTDDIEEDEEPAKDDEELKHGSNSCIEDEENLETAENEENQGEESTKEDEKNADKKEKPAEYLSGFFYAIFKF